MTRLTIACGALHGEDLTPCRRPIYHDEEED